MEFKQIKDIILAFIQIASIYYVFKWYFKWKNKKDQREYEQWKKKNEH